MNPNVDKMPVPDMSVPIDPNKAPVENGAMSAEHHERLMPTESLGARNLMPAQTNVALPDPVSIAAPGQAVAQSHQPAGAAAASSADDDDTSIEKECIAKAKAIVQQTSTDPFNQAKQLSKVKAELLKRRYGKELKLSEG